MKSSSGYEIYHNTLSACLDEIENYVTSKGYALGDYFPLINHISYGSTERTQLEMLKDGRIANTLAIQIYRLDSGKYELNCYPVRKFSGGGGIDERELSIQDLLKGQKYPLTTKELKTLSDKSGYAMGDIEYVSQKINNDIQYNPKFSGGGVADNISLEKIKEDWANIKKSGYFTYERGSLFAFEINNNKTINVVSNQYADLFNHYIESIDKELNLNYSYKIDKLIEKYEKDQSKTLPEKYLYDFLKSGEKHTLKFYYGLDYYFYKIIPETKPSKSSSFSLGGGVESESMYKEVFDYFIGGDRPSSLITLKKQVDAKAKNLNLSVKQIYQGMEEDRSSSQDYHYFSLGGGIEDPEIKVGQVYLNTSSNTEIIISKIENNATFGEMVEYHTNNEEQRYYNTSHDRLSLIENLIDNGTFVLVKNKYSGGGGIGNIKYNFNLETPADYEQDFEEEKNKIKLLKKHIDFDEVKGNIDYEMTIGNTRLKFYKNGNLVMVLNGNYDEKLEQLISIIEIDEVSTKLNYHPVGSFGELSLNLLKLEISKAFQKIKKALKELNTYSATISVEGYEEYAEDVEGLDNAKELMQQIKGNTKFQVLKGSSVGVGKRVESDRVIEEYAKGGYTRPSYKIITTGFFSFKTKDKEYYVRSGLFERQNDTEDSLQIQDELRGELGSIIIQNSAWKRLSDGKTIKARSSKGNLMGTLTRVAMINDSFQPNKPKEIVPYSVGDRFKYNFDNKTYEVIGIGYNNVRLQNVNGKWSDNREVTLSLMNKWILQKMMVKL